MRAKHRVPLALAATTLLILACKDDPISPDGMGLLVIQATFDTTVARAVRSAQPGSSNDPTNSLPGTPRFSSQALDAVEITISQDGNAVSQLQGTRDGNQFVATATNLPIGTYQLQVVGLASSLVEFFGTANATVREDVSTSATVTLSTFQPTVTGLADSSFSTEILLNWNSIRNVEGYIAELADNQGFSGAQNQTLDGATRTAVFSVNGVGTFWARVRAMNSLVGARGLNSTSVSTMVVTEATSTSGDNSATAPSLGFAGALGGSAVTDLNVLPANDIDWFAFDACGSDSVSVTLRTGTLSPASLLEATFSVVDRDSVTRLETDSSTGTADKTLAGSILTGGTYFLTVQGQGNSIGQYELQISVVPGPFTNIQASDCTVTTQGTRVAFVSASDGDREIFARASDGSVVQKLTDNAARDDDPIWSPNGSQLAFRSDRAGVEDDIWVMDSDGANPINITNDPASDDFFPAWFPDGSRLVWASLRTGDPEIFVANADGSGVYKFLDLPSSDEFVPSFSPDGSKLVFISTMDGDAEVWVIDTDGANLTQLTTAGSEFYPSFSPDGSMIAFQSDRDNVAGDIFVMDADGSNQTNVTSNGSADLRPSWSPDGTQLLFNSNRDGDIALFLINTDGTGLARINEQTGVSEFRSNWENPRTVASDLTVFISQAPDTLLLQSDTLLVNQFNATLSNGGQIAYLTENGPRVAWWINDTPDFFTGGDEQFIGAHNGPPFLPTQGSVNLTPLPFPAVGALPGGPLDPGEAFFFALADGPADVAESDEGNNFDAVAVPSAVFFSETDNARLYTESAGGADTLDLFVSEDAMVRGLMIFAIPGPGSTFDPILEAFNNADSYGGDTDGLNGIVTLTTDTILGNGRTINFGEVVAFPVGPNPGDGFQHTAIEVQPSGGSAGQYQLRVERCTLTASAPIGVANNGTLDPSDCVMWPNPISANVSFAEMLSFDATSGDSIVVDMASVSVDAALFLFGPSGNLIASNDDFAACCDARIAGILPATGTYSIIATTVDEFVGGTYSVTIDIVPAVTPMSMTGIQGSGQTILVGQEAIIRPTVLVQDAGGNPVSGATVNFAITGGGGSIANMQSLSNANGLATAGAWTYGNVQGTNTVTATLGGLTPVVFSGQGVMAGFNVELVQLNTPTAAVAAAFDSAEAKWERIIASELADFDFSSTPIGANACGITHPSFAGTVDDLMIWVRLEAIDGTGGILGSAGPCFTRTSNTTTIIGTMRFDTADLANLVSDGTIEAVILHEMGHVVGIGPFWSSFGFLQNPSLPGNSGVDTHFNGPTAIAAFNQLGGTNYTGGAKVPVENTQGGVGTQDVHWRETTFGTELMTGFIAPGSNPLSLLSIGSLADIGLSINPGEAEPYVQVFTVGGNTTAGAVEMKDDVFDGPRFSVSPTGVITRIR